MNRTIWPGRWGTPSSRVTLGSLISLMAVLLGVAVACVPPYPDVITDAEGQPILNEDIQAIVTDDELDEAEKEAALRELGLTDDDLIEHLVRNAI